MTARPSARGARIAALLVAALVVLPAATAHAAGTARITSPGSGATVTAPTPLVAEVVGQAGTFLNPRNHAVRFRIADHTGATILDGTSPVDGTCRENCAGDSTWSGGTFDPATLAPFASRPVCNGTYTLQVRVDDGAWTGHAVRVARAPSAPGEVAVDAGIREATVSWAAAPEPDIAGYRVQRRAGGSWTTVGQVGPDARSLTDDEVAAGEVEYRVASLRGDGQANGQPAPACADTEPDLATASAPVPTTVRSSSTSSTTSAPAKPTPSSSPSDGGTSGDGDGDGTADGQDGEGGTTDGGTTDGDAGSDDAGADGDTATEDDAPAPARRPGNRVAPPAAVGTVSGPGVDVPMVPGADSPQVASEQEERFYGQDDEFSEELDFGDLGSVEAIGEDGTTLETRVVRVPGALQSILGEELDLGRVLGPVAAGLIMLTFALHLRRWTREGLETP